MCGRACVYYMARAQNWQWVLFHRIKFNDHRILHELWVWRITDSENTVYTVQGKKNIDDSVLSELLIAFVEQNKWILQLESERSSFISLFLTKTLNAWTSLFSREREKERKDICEIEPKTERAHPHILHTVNFV